MPSALHVPSEKVQRRIDRARVRGRMNLTEVAYVFGVTTSTVLYWETQGWLVVRRPRSGMTLVRASALRRLCREHPELAAKAEARRLARALRPRV
jgi:DNA-binding transcriptional regulator YiaG